VYRAWRLPSQPSSSERVVLSFTVDAKGAAHDVAVLEASDPRLAESALRAVEETSPFPIPPGAECVTGFKIVGTLTTPGR